MNTDSRNEMIQEIIDFLTISTTNQVIEVFGKIDREPIDQFYDSVVFKRPDMISEQNLRQFYTMVPYLHRRITKFTKKPKNIPNFHEMEDNSFVPQFFLELRESIMKKPSAKKQEAQQNVFEIVINHLYKQGKRSIRPGPQCAYRGASGTSCAVGCLIPDELYDPAAEGFTPLNFHNGSAIKAHLESLGCGLDYLENLMILHDWLRDGKDIDDWRSQVMCAAKDFALPRGLDMTNLYNTDFTARASIALKRVKLDNDTPGLAASLTV